MKFHEVAVGDKFMYNNKVYIKVPELRISCCKIGHNCQVVGTEEKIVIQPMEEVTPVQ